MRERGSKANRPTLQIDFEHDELAGPEGNGAMGQEDSNLDSIFGQTAPWMKHDGSPHERQEKGGRAYLRVTCVAEGLEFPTTVHKPALKRAGTKGGARPCRRYG